MDFYQIAVLCAVAAASSIIASGVALGSGAFLLPVLALVFPPKIALGLGAPIVLASNIIGLRNYWGEWDASKDLLLLIVPGCVGIGAGAYLVSRIPNDTFKTAIGIIAVLFSLYQLIMDAGLARGLGNRVVVSRSLDSFFIRKIILTVIGFLGGIASVFAHAGGLVWSIYFVGKKLDKRCLVSTLLLLFILTNALKMFTYVQIGLLGLDSMLIVLCLFPIVILSGLLGNYLNKKIKPELFRGCVLLIILAIGTSLIIR